jgi:hypothetical protein
MFSFYSFRYWQIICGIFCCVFVITGVTVANAVSELSSLLPSEISAWKAAGKDGIYSRSTLYEYIDGGAEFYLSYGFKDVINRRYTSAGKPDIVSDLFDMATAANAFGVFSQSMETLDESFGQGSQISTGLIIFWKDRYYVSMMAHPETDESKKVLQTLAANIDAAITSEGPRPAIINLLPEKGLVKESIRYFRHHAWLNAYYFIDDRNLLRINDTTETLLAKYDGGEKRLLLLLVEYPDEQSAQQAHGDFVKSCLPNTSEKAPVRLEDGTWTACRVAGKVFMAVFNAVQAVEATHLLDAIEKKKPLQMEGENGKEDKKRVPEK